jgi:hypothetical protein
MSKFFSYIFIFFTLTFIFSHSFPVFATDWDYSYNGSNLLNLSGWSLDNNYHSGINEISDSAYHYLGSSSDESIYSIYTLPNNNSFTFNIRTKIIQGSNSIDHKTLDFIINGNNTQQIYLSFLTNGVNFFYYSDDDDVNIFNPIDTSVYHSYRITLYNNNIKFYIDNILINNITDAWISSNGGASKITLDTNYYVSVSSEFYISNINTNGSFDFISSLEGGDNTMFDSGVGTALATMVGTLKTGALSQLVTYLPLAGGILVTVAVLFFGIHIFRAIAHI